MFSFIVSMLGVRSSVLTKEVECCCLGVGQVVVQIAAATCCQSCYGMEKADCPATYAQVVGLVVPLWWIKLIVVAIGHIIAYYMLAFIGTLCVLLRHCELRYKTKNDRNNHCCLFYAHLLNIFVDENAGKARFPLPELTGDRFPLRVNTGHQLG